jgi:glycerophosphoryl diester phosphodiesterase
MTESNEEPLVVDHGGRPVRLKWHKLRRVADDPPFLRANLRRGLAAGASLEVDLRLLADGRFVCLHDADLDRDTTGSGAVAEASCETVAGLRIRGTGEAPMMLEELVALVTSAAVAAGTRLQLDLQIRSVAIDREAVRAFRRTFAAAPPGLFILSGHDWQAVSRLGADLGGLHLGYDPSDLFPRLTADEIGDHVRSLAPDADTIYLSRRVIREHGAAVLVKRLHRAGHLVDCWTIDRGDPDGEADFVAALDAGVDQITTNTPAAWATSRPSTAGSTSPIP